MSMPEKGSRKIVVDGVAYRWRVSKWKKLGEWRAEEPGEIDAEWLAGAARFGLGDVLEGEFAISVEREKGGLSCMRCSFPAEKVGGFLGLNQIGEITPSLVREIIQRALAAGWDPASRGNVSLTLPERKDGEPDLPQVRTRESNV